MAEAFDYWIIGIQYLRLSEAACQELVKQENVHGVVFSGPWDWEDYLEVTKWSDHSIGIAILFNFFHGIEVLLKGFISLRRSTPKHHKLTDILREFEKEFPESGLSSLARKHTVDLDPSSPLGLFLAKNRVSVDEWYVALKYPESTKGHTYTHADLKYGGSNTLNFWKSIGETAVDLRKEAVKLSVSAQ